MMGMDPNSKKKNEPQEKMDREEILDILKRNVILYKNDPDFVNYFVDLALYLLEYHYIGYCTDIKPKSEQQGGFDGIGSKVYRIIKPYGTDTEKYCRICGAPTGGMMKCPHCGNLT